LFAGIGGIERGLAASGQFEAEFLCEWWAPARHVLAARFPDAMLAGDILDIDRLPDVDLVAGGFPCTDLSLAGRMAGIDGAQSGLVHKALGLVERHPTRWLLLENVKNMLPLHGGRAMRAITDELSRMGFRWAYRVVDSRFTGVPQRRQRVIILASRTDDPRTVLFADDAGEPEASRWRNDAFGFYWTEGYRALGWCQDGVPTLKGGSTIGIPSPPAIWLPNNVPGRRIVTPNIEVTERLQGFPSEWTVAAAAHAGGERSRWRLTGNAVTVGVARWVGSRLLDPGEWESTLSTPLKDGAPWPSAAWGERGQRWRVNVSMWPTLARHQHLSQMVADDVKPLSARATEGFLARLIRSDLVVPNEFVDDLQSHLRNRREEAA
jgi:DNA (cytosine-5)-methyltransferase 1